MRPLLLIKRRARPLVLWAIRYVLAKPGLKARGLIVLARHPGLKERLRGLAMAAMSQPEEPYPITQPEMEKSLSPRAASILAELTRAIEARKN